MSETQDTSQSMINALAAGDEESFEEAYRIFCQNYHLVIRRWCGRWFHLAEDADDAAQELLVKLHKRLKRFRVKEEVRFRNWLSRTSKRLAIDLLRKQKHIPQEISEHETLPGVTDFVENLLIDHERREFIRNALNKVGDLVGDRDRQVLELYLQEFKPQEIAETLGGPTTSNAVHQALYRVRQKLKQELQGTLCQFGLDEADLFPA